MEGFPERLKKELESIEQKGLRRQLEYRPGLVDFCSNDYFGYADVPLRGEGYPGGAGGARLLAGNFLSHAVLESACSAWLGTEACLFFSSGYLANLGLLSAVAGRGDTYVYDERCHASLKDGMRLSPARRFPFRHNDPEDLRNKLSQAKGTVFVVTEALFSMDGDLAPLREMSEIAEQAGAYLIVDEAHSTGLYPEWEGAGWTVESECPDRIFARIHTFGKAMGRSGAVVAGSEDLKKYLINRSRPFIYTTAPSPALAADLAEQLARLKKDDAARKQLRENCAYFAQSMGLSGADARSPIFAFSFPGNARAREAAARMQALGCYVKPILSPTVPEGTERLRVVIHAQHTRADLDLLSDSLKQVQRELLPAD